MIVSEQENNFRLDFYLANVLKISRSKVTNLVKTKKVMINHQVIIKPATLVKVNDNIELLAEDPAFLNSIEPEVKINIVFQDAYLLVVYKPTGMVVYPDDQHYNNTLVQSLKSMGITLADNDPLRSGVVHRLDKNTEGLLLFAKNEKTLILLQNMFKERLIEKHYYAIVSGQPVDDYYKIELPIGRHPKYRHKMSTLPNAVNPRMAITEVLVLQRFSTQSLVDVRIHTGRTHQIRVHLQHLGYPVVGDPVYQAKKKLGQQQKLQAYYLKFQHPVTKEILEFKQPLSKRLLPA